MGCSTAASPPAPGQEATTAASSVNLSLPEPLAPGKGVTRDEEREVGALGSSALQTNIVLVTSNPQIS